MKSQIDYHVDAVALILWQFIKSLKRGSRFDQSKMKAMWLKLFAGVLLLLTGVLVLLVLFVHCVGHTAAGFSKSEYIIGGVLSVLLIFSAIAVFAAALYNSQRNVRKK